MIPTASNFPESFDTDTELFLVHDSLRVRLIEDYSPGDTSIQIFGDEAVIANFPATGLITLTEQCSEIDERAISFFYGSKTDSSFDDLEILPGFKDVIKLKNITNVTQNVMAKHHNSLKDALIAIEEFLGVEGTVDVRPFGDTLEGRINFLRKLVLAPRAWFTANKRIGIVPLTVQFRDQSFRNPTSFEWNFGDGTSPSTISVDEIVPSTSLPSLVIDTDGGTITKTYFIPGVYDASLTVENEFGSDTVIFPNYIIARVQAPDEATITINPSKAKINSLINLEVTATGEQTNNNVIIDNIVEYSWTLGDDLVHPNSSSTIASWSIGGFYDIKLRVDTELDAYRITTIEDAIEIVELTNLWMLNFNSEVSNTSNTKIVSAYEFGLISETFKSAILPQAITRNHSFIDNTYSNDDYQRALFRRNNGFAPRDTTTSGDRGKALIYWAEDESNIRFKEFRPFDELWVTPAISGTGGGSDSISRNWNWIGLNSPTSINFVFGNDIIDPLPVDVNQDKDKITLSGLVGTTTTFVPANYINGADELNLNPDALPSTYKSTWKGAYGYILSNENGPGGFFRLQNFYKTEGTTSELVQNFRKLPDIIGSTKLEGELAALSSGIFFFDNSGEVMIFNTTTNTWSTAGPGAGSFAFRSLQDVTVSGSADLDQTLRVASDGDRRAYLSFDYSPKAFIKFNETDLTFTLLPNRPSGEQFVMGVY